MISGLRGILRAKQPPLLLLEVNGVFYELEVPLSTFDRLPELEQPVQLHTHFVVREDAQLLYGFATLEERTTFRTLIKISGIGAKIALALLSGLSVTELARCVAEQNTALLIRLPGVGKKTAERLLLELRDKLPTGTTPSSGPRGLAQQDAQSALLALGYSAAEAQRLLQLVADPALDSASLIRQALQATLTTR
jgi:Holliday junction DNA helicase RuvA